MIRQFKKYNECVQISILSLHLTAIIELMNKFIVRCRILFQNPSSVADPVEVDPDPSFKKQPCLPVTKNPGPGFDPQKTPGSDRIRIRDPRPLVKPQNCNNQQ